MNKSLIIQAYIYCGLSRGSLIASVSTVTIKMYSLSCFYPFDLSKPIISTISVSVLVGSALGSFIASPIIKKLGRRKTLICFSLIQVVSEIFTFIPVNWIYLSIFRIIAGVASNFTLTSVPMLCAEFLEPIQRGAIGSVLNIAISSGIVITNVIQYFICLNYKLYWIIMLLPVLSSLFTFIISFKLLEINQNIGIVQQTEKIFQYKYIRCFLVAIGLGFLISGTGINPALQYSTIILKNSFDNVRSSSIGSIISTGINLIASIIALPIIRRFKRKSLLSFGFSFMFVTHNNNIQKCELE
ncbi:Hexose_transporter [Hexamita inflata]|uniref:Hexose transporter n=1 Tax=Hexamita inflata TaxID=28002 RepID=A0AA86NH33_9EUKA|nr:Hexose transporter [Hexamita inflata]